MSSPRVGCLAVRAMRFGAMRIDVVPGIAARSPDVRPGSWMGRLGAAAIGDESSTIANANGSDHARRPCPRPADRSASPPAPLGDRLVTTRRRAVYLKCEHGALTRSGRSSAPWRLVSLPWVVVEGSELLLIRKRRAKFAKRSREKSRGRLAGCQSGRHAVDRDHAVSEADNHVAAVLAGQSRQRRLPERSAPRRCTYGMFGCPRRITARMAARRSGSFML
jgi:hypothetical protein